MILQPLATWDHLLGTMARQIDTEGRVQNATALVWLHRWLTEVRYGVELAEPADALARRLRTACHWHGAGDVARSETMIREALAPRVEAA